MDFGSLLAGAAQAGSADITQRRQSALEYKMRSALIAQQLQQQQEVEQERWNREQVVSPSALGALSAVYKNNGLGNVPIDKITNQREFQTMATLAGHLVDRKNKPHEFAGDQPVHEMTVRDLMSSGIPERVARNARQSDMKERNMDPDRTMFEETRRFITAGKRLPDYKKAVKEMFSGSKYQEMKGRFSKMSDKEIIKAIEPDLSSLSRQLVSILGPADAGKAQTLIELENLKSQLGSWYQGEESFNKTIDGLVDRVMEDHVRKNLDSGRMGRARGILVDEFNKLAGSLKIRKANRYLPQYADHENQDKNEDKARNWAAQISAAIKAANGNK